ncbi:MAG TPA: N-acetylglucosamine-6-phosphate deacetylase [Sphaerochaeta sp.]|nr:N-acetylglucosamine-6-phosphate deacetylase [Sphaerochaeta sp.]
MKEKITAKSVFSNTPMELGIEDGKIISVQQSNVAPDASLDYIAPGFFDIQVNGYAGKDYTSALTPDEILHLVGQIAKSGTTQHVATVITNSEEQMIKSIKAIVEARKAHPMVEKGLVGIHVEGPFISAGQGSRGVHDPRFIRPCDYEEFLRWQKAAEGLVRIVTISPEDENALDFIRKVSATGVIVGIGHTNAEPSLIASAVEAGATLSTHLGNGSAAMLPRLENFLWKQLSEDRLSASIIADGFHLPPYVLDSFTKAKGKERLILISDAAALAGSPPGVYRWGEMKIEVFEDGHMGLAGTSSLAGASLLLDTCVAHLCEVTAFSLADSVACATANPHALFGETTWTEVPRVGTEADFILFSYREGERKLSVNRSVLGKYTLFQK